MRATPAETKPATQATNGESQSADVVLLTAMLDRISAERAACEKLGDPELAQRASRKVLTAVACAADAILADAKTLHSAPEKIAAFFDKSATACVAAIEGLHKRAVLADPAAADAFAAGRPRVADPLANSYVAWGSTAPPLRRE